MVLDFYLFNLCLLTGLASVYPEPKDLERHIHKQMYNFYYERSVPLAWEWKLQNKEKLKERQFREDYEQLPKQF